jgi:hypothetical protein
MNDRKCSNGDRRRQVKGHGEKFSRKMEEAIIALLTQPTIPEAAKAAGVSDTTLWRWLQDPEFQAAYREARQQAVGQAIAQLQQLGSAAVRALKSVIEDEKAPHSARVAAARAAFELAYRGVEVEDLAERVAAIEARFKSEGCSHVQSRATA